MWLTLSTVLTSLAVITKTNIIKIKTKGLISWSWIETNTRLKTQKLSLDLTSLAGSHGN